MTTGPGTVDRVVVVALTVVDVVGVGVLEVLEVLVELDDAVLAARVRSPPPPPLQAARISRPSAVTSSRTLLVSPHGLARDARAPAGRDLRPAAGDRPSR